MPASHLHRVLKRIKHNDGKMHKQAFYVKKAAPGDVYSQNKPMAHPTVQSSVPVQNQSEPDIKHDINQLPQEHRIEVQPLVVPWLLASESEENHDPIPAEIRRRFDPNNRAQRHRDPIASNIPMFTIKPG